MKVPNEMTSYVYDILQEKGRDHGLKDCGYYALESLRIEKGNRAWGIELKSDINPIEAGLAFTIDWKKEDFSGKKALLNTKKYGTNKRIISLTLENDLDMFLLGDEPIYRNNELVGYVTSTKYGYSLEKWVCLAALKVESGKITKDWIEKGDYEIEVLQVRKKATAHIKGPYDPQNKEIMS